jgi:inhibitor of cysteine peptidase
MPSAPIFGLDQDLLGSGAESKGDVVKVRLLVTVAVLMLSTVVGCHFASRNPPSTKTLHVPMTDVLTKSEITQNVTLAVGNTLVVELGSNYTTPYRWTPDTKIGDSSVIKQLSHAFKQPASDALGAPGTEVWTFTALRPGTTTVSTEYTSFVGKDAKPACSYTLTVTVQ